jgi:hypothetical protein
LRSPFFLSVLELKTSLSQSTGGFQKLLTAAAMSVSNHLGNTIVKNCWTNELRIMVHPTATYRRLATNVGERRRWLLIRRPLFVAFVFGSFVSLTVSGHLTLSLIFDGMIFWGFVPGLQALLLIAILLAVARDRMRISKAIDLFFMGHCPWLLWLLGVAGTCLFFPLKQIYLWPTKWGWVLPISLLGAWIWSNVTSFGFLRGALDLSMFRASVALVLYTVMLWGIIISYLLAVEGLQLHRLRL